MFREIIRAGSFLYILDKETILKQGRKLIPAIILLSRPSSQMKLLAIL